MLRKIWWLPLLSSLLKCSGNTTSNLIVKSSESLTWGQKESTNEPLYIPHHICMSAKGAGFRAVTHSPRSRLQIGSEQDRLTIMWPPWQWSHNCWSFLSPGCSVLFKGMPVGGGKRHNFYLFQRFKSSKKLDQLGSQAIWQ